MGKGTFGVRRWLCKIMFEGVPILGVCLAMGELGCFRFQRNDLIPYLRVGTRKWLAKV